VRAGFVTDVSLGDAQALLPYITGQKPPTGDMVRTPFLDEEVFPEEWPPRHVISCYRDGDGLLVTILLFGALAYACRFQFGAPVAAGVRYAQTLTANYPEFYDDVRRPPAFTAPLCVAQRIGAVRRPPMASDTMCSSVSGVAVQ
jgi:hypothetical protein